MPKLKATNREDHEFFINYEKIVMVKSSNTNSKYLITVDGGEEKLSTYFLWISAKEFKKWLNYEDVPKRLTLN